jgi:uncharacterized membrane protein YdbT with pleckstrin-like domain
VARRVDYREGERRVVSVTPVPRGVYRPALVALAAAAADGVGAHYLALVRHHLGWFVLGLVGPPLVVLATRTWRWRSHKVHVTTERVVVEGGVARRHRASVELADVGAVHVEQRVTDRLSRSGTVLVDTPAGTLSLGRLRHPAAVVRVIERERGPRDSGPPLDTVFGFEDPAERGYRADPRWRSDAP